MSRLRRHLRITAAAWALALSAIAAPARAQDGDSSNNFAVINLVNNDQSELVAREVEKEVVRLKPGAKPIDDASIRHLLITGEGQGATGVRSLAEVTKLVDAGDCAAAMDRADKAEPLVLGALPFDDEREHLKRLYAQRVICEHKLGRTDRLRAAALQLRELVQIPPDGFPKDVWDNQVAALKTPAADIELQIDSEPANAQIQAALHGMGVTPRTVKVPPGSVLVEVQKEGYKKAFRRVDVKTSPTRVLFRLVPRGQDRLEQAQASLTSLVQGSNEIAERSKTLSQLAQIARADTLVVVGAKAGRARIWFFDAERGALTETPIDSAYDPATGRVAALASRGVPAAAAPAAAPSAAPTAETPAAPATKPPASALMLPPAQPGTSALPEAQARQQLARQPRRRVKDAAPWWSWALAGAVAVGFGLFLLADNSGKTDPKLGVVAKWPPE